MATFKDWTIQVDLKTTKAEAGLKRLLKLQERINRATRGTGGKGSTQETVAARNTNKAYMARKTLLTDTNSKLRKSISLEKKLRAEAMLTNAEMRRGGRKSSAAASNRATGSGGGALTGGAVGGMMARAAGPAAIAIAVGVGVKKLFQAGKQLENIKATLLAASGSAAQAALDFEKIKESSMKIGVDLTTAADGYAKIGAAARASGFSAEETNDAFMASIEASRAFGLSADRTALVNLAFSQMISKGVVSMEELRRQLGEQIPGGFNIAAKSMNMTAMELDKLVSSGKLMTKDFLPKFTVELRKMVRESGALDKAMNSTQAKQERFMNTLKQMADSVFQMTTTNMSGGIFEDMQVVIEDLQPLVEQLMLTIGGGLKVILKVLQPITWAVRQVGTLLESIGWIMTKVLSLAGKLAGTALDATFGEGTSGSLKRKAGDMLIAGATGLHGAQTMAEDFNRSNRNAFLGMSAGNTANNTQTNNITVVSDDPERAGEAVNSELIRAGLPFDTQN